MQNSLTNVQAQSSYCQPRFHRRTSGKFLSLRNGWRLTAKSQWNPSVENQAIARALRLGQKQAVIVTRYVVEQTVEQVSCSPELISSIADTSQDMRALQEMKLERANLVERDEAGKQPGRVTT
jgi:hypothetical protein